MRPAPELLGFLERFYAAYRAGDAEAVTAMYEPGEGVLCIGTAAEEWWTDNDSHLRDVAAQLQAAGGFPFYGGDAQAWEEGSVGWIGDRPVLRVPEGDVPLRLTLVLHRTNDWKIVQVHCSAPARNQDIGWE